MTCIITQRLFNNGESLLSHLEFYNVQTMHMNMGKFTIYAVNLPRSLRAVALLNT